MARYDGRKMSKSLGNLVKVSQALQRAPAAAVRLYLVGHRYRRDWSFEWQGLARSARLVEGIAEFLAQDARGATRGGSARPGRALMAGVKGGLGGDLHTPRAGGAQRAAGRGGGAGRGRWVGEA